MTFKLLKIFLSNLFSFGDFIDGFKKGFKSVAKNILLIICFLYLVFFFGFIYILFTINTYKSLDVMGQAGLFPCAALLITFLVIFNFGIMSVATSYYAGNGEEQFLSMPITAKEFFTAKFFVSFITDGLIGVFLFFISAGYYGFKEGLLANPLFYVGVLVTAFAFSIIVIGFIYFLLIAILYFIPCLRKRSLLTGISSFFVIIIAIVFGWMSGFTGGLAGAGGEDAINSIFVSLSGRLNDIAGKYAVLSFFSNALKGYVAPILILLLIIFLFLFVLIPLLSRLYIKTFEGASDIKTKRLSKDKIDRVVKSESKRNSIFKTMYIRDVKSVLREPVFFTNGPLGVFLFPVILIFSVLVPFFVNGDTQELLELGSAIKSLFNDVSMEEMAKIKYFTVFGLISFSLFCGCLTSIASTSFSREGKGFYTLKAMPVSNEIIVKVKFFHAFTYILISCLITSVIFIAVSVILGMPFSLYDMFSMIVLMFVVVSLISSLLIIIDMLFDTVNPKLNWENPTGAVKQNMNTLFGMLVSLVTIGLFVFICVLCGLYLSPSYMTLIVIGAVSGVIAAITGSWYFKYADKKIPLM